jgi:hypothetical protein
MVRPTDVSDLGLSTGDIRRKLRGVLGWYDSEDEDIDEIFWLSESNSDSDSELDWWAYSEQRDLDYLPGRDEYEYMNAELCPLCGGNCMYLVKKEVMEDLDDIKWRDPFFGSL